MTLTRTASTVASPVMEARRWISGVTFPPERPLLNVSQAAPVDPPIEAMRQEMARVALEVPSAHLYGPVLGLPELRAEVAKQFSEAYGGALTPENVCITSGCNQAFCAALETMTSEGDEVLLPTPWYFNHKMWLDMIGVSAVPIPPGPGLLPRVEDAEALITAKTRAIVLVTPNNPGGVEYPADLVGAFFDLARRHGLKLLVDETYRDFDSRSGAPHDLLTREGWDSTLIQLYSFSKAYRLTGHRVGAMVASPETLAEGEKFLDTVTICPNQIAQHAALWGMQNLGQWLGGERAEILARRAAIEAGFPLLAAKGWKLLGCGAYFAWMDHPFNEPSDALAKRLVHDAGILALPGTMFTPEGDAFGKKGLRIAFANIDASGISEIFQRLAAIS